MTSKAALTVTLLLAASNPAAEPVGDDPVRQTSFGQLICDECWLEELRTKADDCPDICAESTSPLLYLDRTVPVVRTLGGGPFMTTEWRKHVGRPVQVTGFVTDTGASLTIDVEQYAVSDDEPRPVNAHGTPDLVLKDLAGVEQRLSAFEGRVVVLNFWATWCVPCRIEMPTLARTQRAYPPSEVTIIAAASDGPSSRSLIDKLIASAKITFPIWLGANASDMRAFGFGNTVPSTVIIDREGRIRWRKVGIVPEAELRVQIDQALATSP